VNSVKDAGTLGFRLNITLRRLSVIDLREVVDVIVLMRSCHTFVARRGDSHPSPSSEHRIVISVKPAPKLRARSVYELHPSSMRPIMTQDAENQPLELVLKPRA
jgi:hypothetical protein